MSITKYNLIDGVRQSINIMKSEAAKVIESTLDIIKSTLANGEPVHISGFGKFDVKDKARRRGRNPQTGEDKMLEPRRVVTFRCSPVLRDKMNKTD